MFTPLYVAASGLNAFDQEMMDITNNLSNSKTVGYKKNRVEMEALFSQVLAEAGRRLDDTRKAPLGIEFGTGVKVAATSRDFSQGTIQVTKNPLDLAINGDGFFQFRLPNGDIGYSRSGNLHADSEGNLVNASGYLLDPQIALPAGTTNVLVKPDGTVLVQVNNETNYTEVGQITLARFTNPQGLKSLGQNLYGITEASGEPQVGVPGEESYGEVAQFSLESSNVDVVEEMMRMIIVQRIFDTITKAVQSYDTMLTSIGRMRG